MGALKPAPDPQRLSGCGAANDGSEPNLNIRLAAANVQIDACFCQRIMGFCVFYAFQERAE
jgi:hypothetical protein